MEEYIEIEDLEAASAMFDDLVNGSFYQKQEESGFTINYIKEEQNGKQSMATD